jgi:hypothetical protein
VLRTKAAAAFRNDAMDLVPDMISANVEWNLCQEKITTCLKFLAPSPRWLTEKPFCLTIPLPEGQPRSNTIICTVPNLLVGNGRGMESSFQLDKNGFEFSSLPPLPQNLNFDDHVGFESGYLQDMANLLKEKLKADAVFVFDYTVCYDILLYIRKLTSTASLLKPST